MVTKGNGTFLKGNSGRRRRRQQQSETAVRPPARRAGCTIPLVRLDVLATGTSKRPESPHSTSC